MRPRAGRGEQLRGLVLHIFRILFAFLQGFLLHFRPVAFGNEVVRPHTELERALVSVECRAPGILRLRVLAPVALVPDDLHFAMIEQCSLGIVQIDV